jgi:hypothetical protein
MFPLRCWHSGSCSVRASVCNNASQHDGRGEECARRCGRSPRCGERTQFPVRDCWRPRPVRLLSECVVMAEVRHHPDSERFSVGRREFPPRSELKGADRQWIPWNFSQSRKRHTVRHDLISHADQGSLVVDDRQCTKSRRLRWRAISSASRNCHTLSRSHLFASVLPTSSGTQARESSPGKPERIRPRRERASQ